MRGVSRCLLRAGSWSVVFFTPLWCGWLVCSSVVGILFCDSDMLSPFVCYSILCFGFLVCLFFRLVSGGLLGVCAGYCSLALEKFETNGDPEVISQRANVGSMKKRVFIRCWPWT